MSKNIHKLPPLTSPRPAKRAHVEANTPSKCEMRVQVPTPSLTTPSKKNRLLMRYTSPAQTTQTKKKQTPSADRFIPDRRRVHSALAQRSLRAGATNSNTAHNSKAKTTSNQQDSKVTLEFQRHLLSAMCSVPVDAIDIDPEQELPCQPKCLFSSASTLQSDAKLSKKNKNMPINPSNADELRVLKYLEDDEDEGGINRVRSTAVHRNRDFSSKPVKILDAPGISCDFYSHLTAWGDNGLIAVALGLDVYTYNPATTDTTHLTDLSGRAEISTVAWCPTPGAAHLLTVGYRTGDVVVYDCKEGKIVRIYRDNHSMAVCCLTWKGSLLASGSRDESICLTDFRAPASDPPREYLRHHKGTVCNMKWNQAGTVLASGGNDDIVCLWDAKMMGSRVGGAPPRSTLVGHKGAVKAMDWCPHSSNILASGGGSCDQTVMIWNTDSAALLNSTRVHAQISAVQWSPVAKELITSHGFQLSATCGELGVWKYERDHSLTNLHTIHGGHKGRVLGLVLSPDGSTVMSSGEDQMIMFWEGLFGEQPRRVDTSIMGGLSLGPCIR